MSMTSLVNNIDDQFLNEARQKAMVAQVRQQEGLRKMLPQVQGDWHKEVQKRKDPDASEASFSTVQYFGELAKEEGVYPEGPEAKFWEDYWLARMKVNRLFWEPRREFKVKEFAGSWWALMKLFEDQKAPAWPTQPQATVDKAFNTNALQSVFPIFFDTNIVAGLLADPVLDRLVSSSVSINSHTATHVKMTDVDGDQMMGEAGEGTSAIQLIIKEAERTVKLRKFMGEIDWTYEVMRLQRMDVLARSLVRIGTRYNQLKTDFAVATLIDGDGAGDGAITDSAAASTGNPVYSDLVTAEFAFNQGYTPDTILAPKQVLTDLLNMAQYVDPLAGILHQTTGAIPRPLGMDLVRWDSTGRVSTYLSTTAVMFDSDLALVQYSEGGIITESERVIKSQWERSVISEWVGFAVWDRASAIRLTGW
jgi:hypothetical protein